MIFRSKRGATFYLEQMIKWVNNPNPNEVIDVIGAINIDSKSKIKLRNRSYL